VRTGFWLVRARLGRAENKTVIWGPASPACIVRLHTRHEPGHPENLMERSPFFAAFVSGEPIGLYDLFPTTDHEQERIFRVERAISQPHYDRLMREIAEARRADRYLPMALPFKPIKIEALEVPFL